MLGSNTKKYLIEQKRRMIELSKDDILKKCNFRDVQDDQGNVTNGFEQILDNTIFWLNSREAHRMLFQEQSYLEHQLSEGTLTTDISGFTVQALPMVRRVFAKSVMAGLVSNQPMKSSTGYIYYRNVKYGDDFSTEGITDGDRTDQKYPYQYGASSESGVIHELDYEIKSKQVTCLNYKLKSAFSLESQQDLMAQHGLDLPSEIGAALADEISREIDRRIIASMYAGVGYNVSWNKNGQLGTGTDSTADVMAYRETLFTDGVMAANSYILGHKYVNGGFLLLNASTFQYLVRLNMFRISNLPQDQFTTVGIQYVGTLLPSFDVYVTPSIPDDKILIGHKPTSWDYSVAYLATFVPIFLSETYISNNDFTQLVRGAMSRFACGLVPSEHDGTVNDGLATVTITSS